MAKDPNLSNDMQGRIKIPVLLDFFGLRMWDI